MIQALEKELENEDDSDGSSPQAPSDEASPPAPEPSPPSDSENVVAAEESPAPTVHDDPATSPPPLDDDTNGQPVEQIPGDAMSMKSTQLVDLVSDGECEGEGVVEETFAASSTQPAKLKKHEYPEWYDPLKEDEQLPPEFWDMCTPSPQPSENKGRISSFCFQYCFLFYGWPIYQMVPRNMPISPSFVFCLEANLWWI